MSDYSSTAPVRILLVSQALAEADLLARSAGDGVLTLVYDPAGGLSALGDGVAALAAGRPVASIGLAAHGSAAGFGLTAGAWVGGDYTAASAEQQAFWGRLTSLLAPEGRIDFLACDFAASAEGRLYLAALESNFGVNFAASTNRTGAAALGGDWTLETDGVDAAAAYFAPGTASEYVGVLISQYKPILYSDTIVTQRQDGVFLPNQTTYGYGSSTPVLLSSDGRYVAFESTASGFGTHYSYTSPLVKDMQTGSIVDVSDARSIFGPNAYFAFGSNWKYLSEDGSIAIFYNSTANAGMGFYRKNLQSGFIEQLYTSYKGYRQLVNFSSSGLYSTLLRDPENGRAFLDADQLVTFATVSSSATTIDKGFFRFNLAASTAVLIQTDVTNTPTLSRFVAPGGGSAAYVKAGYDAVTQNYTKYDGFYLCDLSTGQSKRLDVNQLGVAGDDYSTMESFSDDGKKLLFTSQCSNLLPVDQDHTADYYYYDIPTGTMKVLLKGSGYKFNGFAAPDGSKLYITKSNQRYIYDISSDAIFYMHAQSPGFLDSNRPSASYLSKDATKLVYWDKSTGAGEMLFQRDLVSKPGDVWEEGIKTFALNKLIQVGDNDFETVTVRLVANRADFRMPGDATGSSTLTMTGLPSELNPKLAQVLVTPSDNSYYINAYVKDPYFPEVSRTFYGSMVDGYNNWTPVAVGQTLSAGFQTAGDIDQFQFALTAGSRYAIDLKSTGGASGCADVHMSLVDAQGGFIAYDNDSGGGTDARILFTPTAAGNYGVYALGAGGATGGYTITATLLDDYQDGLWHRIAPYQTVGGGIQSAGDLDMFTISLNAGTAYVIDLKSTGGATGCADVHMSLWNPQGGFVAWNNDSGGGKDARIVFTPTASGDYGIYAAGLGGATGGYTLLVGEQDEYVDGVWTPAALGQEIGGGIQTPTDLDMFTFNLTAGNAYCIDLKSTGGASGCADVHMSLWNPQGGFVAYDNDSGGGKDARIVFTPTESGAYGLYAAGLGGATGGYTLKATANDDYPDGVWTPVALGQVIGGGIQTPTDLDAFQCVLAGGQSYTLDLKSTGGARGCSDVHMSLWDGAGNFLAWDNDSGGGKDARIAYTPSKSGNYRIYAAGFGGVTGDYIFKAGLTQQTGMLAQGA